MNNVFSENPDFRKNAYLNWRTDRREERYNLYVIAEGYKDAALTLCSYVLDDNVDSKADSLIFPIMFNANHSIEVYLKALSWTYNILLGTTDKFALTHNLNRLLSEAIRLGLQITELSSSEKNDFRQYHEVLTAYVNDLSNKTADITFTRYTITRSSEQHFYVEDLENVVIDMENITEVYKEIFHYLDTLKYFFEEKVNSLFIRQE